MKKKLLFVCLGLIFFVSCDKNNPGLFKLNDVERIENAYQLITLTTKYDTFNSVLNSNLRLKIKLDSTKVTHEHDILIQTDYGYLSEIPNINSANSRKEITIRSAGLKVEALLSIDPELNNNITISASITSSDNTKYSVNKKIYLSEFKPDKISLSLNKDSLKIGENGLITGELQSIYGRVSDNLTLNFTTTLTDSAEVRLTQEKVLSFDEKVYTNIVNSNGKSGIIKVVCLYGNEIVSDTLEVYYYD